MDRRTADFAERNYPTSNEASAKVGPGPNLKAADLSTLDRICARIENVSQYLHGQANALHAHADRVHGPRPVAPTSAADEMRDRPCAALDRIWLALDELDQARERASGAAERNLDLA